MEKKEEILFPNINMNMHEKAQVTVPDIEKLLIETWGEDSPISHIQNPMVAECNGKIFEDIDIQNLIGHTILYPLFKNFDFAGVIGLKLIDQNTVEVGNIALKKCFRGTGLSSTLYELIENDIKTLVEYFGFNIVTYATVGSPVLYKIIDNIECSVNRKDLMFPMNIAPYIVPTTTNDICEPFCLKQRDSNLTSTVEILSLRKFQIPKFQPNQDSRFHELLRFYQHLLPISDTSNCENSYIELPINMDILTLNILRTNIADTLKMIRNDKPVQIRIPISQQYSEMVNELFKQNCLLTGITISNDQTYFCFMKNLNSQSRELLSELSKKGIPKVSQLSQLLQQLNTNYHT